MSEFIDIGEAGHIDSASGLGMWPEGQQLLERLCDDRVRQGERRELARQPVVRTRVLELSC